VDQPTRISLSEQTNWAVDWTGANERGTTGSTASWRDESGSEAGSGLIRAGLDFDPSLGGKR